MTIWVELPLELPSRWYIHSIAKTPEAAAEIVRILLHKTRHCYQGIRLSIINSGDDETPIAGIPGNVLDYSASGVVPVCQGEINQ